MLYERNACVPVDFVNVLVEMWPTLRSIAISRKFIDVVEIL